MLRPQGLVATKVRRHYNWGMDIATTLRKVARQRRLSVYRIAKDTGLNQSGLNQFFNGTKDELRLSTVQALFDYLGLEIKQRKITRR